LATNKHLERAELALRDHALRYPETTEEFPWEHRAIKVKGKIFLFLFRDSSELSLSLKLPDSHKTALMLPFASPAQYGLAKSGWVTARFEGKSVPPVEMLTEWIDESFRAIAPKRVLATWGASLSEGHKANQSARSTNQRARKSKPRNARKPPRSQ